MRKLIPYLFILLLSFGWGQIKAQTCTVSIDSSTPYIDAAAYPNIQAGDTVCLKSGNWDYIYLKGFHGTKDKPITFVNSLGAVVIKAITQPTNYVGIKIGNCSHIIFRGNGVSNIQYGFQVDTVAAGAGMGIDDFSTNIEISHVEISHTAIGGVYAKTDPTCTNFNATRDKFTMYNFSFHDCYVHDVPNEGLYIGNSHYTGLHLTSTCDTTVYPQVLKGVKIYNNIIEHTGYDGIQVSSADSGCVIHDNVVKFDSQSGTPSQMSGIIIGGGSKCTTYNNQIIDGKGDGIEVFGLGDYSIFNNLIVNAGKSYLPDQPNEMKQGIYVGTDSTAAHAKLGIYNNTIISPKSFGITLSNTQLDSTKIINNLITTPGQYQNWGPRSFININSTSIKVDTLTNYTTNDTATVKFVAPDALNYELKPNSPAVDFGTNLTGEGVTFDLLNQPRPYHTYYDAGAYECQDPSVGIITHKAPDLAEFLLYPNPVKRKLNVRLTFSDSQTVTAQLTDLFGRILSLQKLPFTAGQSQLFTFSVHQLPQGTYFITIISDKGISSKGFIVQY
ncbi:MAG: right-handed parallel beta-helix repeat-containing protein [Bacteroidales bacterium]|nr:right-handed parallel beta-helix repeat-containing protein [Bacteroidales bacterium]